LPPAEETWKAEEPPHPTAITAMHEQNE